MACEFPNLAVFEILPYCLCDSKKRPSVEPPFWRKMVHMEQYNPHNVDVLAGRMRLSVRVKDKYDRSWHRTSCEGRTFEYCLIPCGQCMSCRLEYSRQWAMRCMLEASQHEFNYFVTLTYAENGFRPDFSKRKRDDDDRLPDLIDKETGLPVPMLPCKLVDNWLEDVSGELHDNVLVHPLQPEDMQLFLKRLRKFYFDKWKKSFPDEFQKYTEMKKFGEDFDNIRSICKHMPDIRFYGCGEYGPQTLRPHYHLILFNCFIPDLEFVGHSKSGAPMYNSEIFKKLWPYGFAVIEECTYKACAYVARYMLKKHKGLDADWYVNHGLEPEFSRCSRRPGIARKFLDENLNLIYDRDSVIVNTGDKVLEVHPPQYYDRIFADHHPFEMEAIKDKRRFQNALQESARFYKSGVKRSDFDSAIASQRKAQARALPRGN